MFSIFGSLDSSFNELLVRKEELGRVACILEIAKRLNEMRNSGVILSYKAMGDLLDSLTPKTS